MPVIRWVFTDPVLSTTRTFAINPSEGGSPIYRKTISYQNTLAPGGNVLIFEGQNEAKTIEFTGVVLEQVDYDAMILWFSKRYIITLTDDLSRVYNIYITEFVPTRSNRIRYPWYHKYTVKATII